LLIDLFLSSNAQKIIERGHIFYCPTALFKIQNSGKHEQYIKMKAAMDQHLIEVSLDGSHMHVNADAPGGFR